MIEDNTTTLSSRTQETKYDHNDDSIPVRNGIDFVSAYRALIGAYVRTLLRDEPNVPSNMQVELEVAVA